MLKELPKTNLEIILPELLAALDNDYIPGECSILEKVDLPLVISDLSGNILDINQAGLNLSGYNYEQLKSIVFDPLIISSPEEDYFPDHPFEYGILYLPDIWGQVHYFWVEILKNKNFSINLLTPAEDYPGGENLLARLYLDELRKSNTEIRKMIDAYTNAIKLSPAEAVLCDGTNLVYVTEKFCKVTGYKEEELLAMTSLEWIAPASRRYISAIIEQVINRKIQNKKYQAMIITADGQRIPYEFNISSLNYKDTMVALLIGSDISQLREQELIRRHNRRKTNVVNRIMRILAETQGVENAIGTILQCLREEFAGFGFEIGLWDDDKHISMYSCVNGTARNYTLRAESNHRLWTVINQQRTVSHAIGPSSLFDEDSTYRELGYRNIIQIPIKGLAQPFGIFRCLITEPTLETNLIEEIVAEIVLALQTFLYREKIAQISREAAEQEVNVLLSKFSLIGEMSASIAHEVRNPMTTVKGIAQLLEMEHPEKAEYYQLMAEEVNRANEILTDFLSLSKQYYCPPAQVNLKEILKRTVDLLYAEILHHAVKILCKFKPDIWVFGDEERLRQAFLNILINAVEASQPGNTITIKTWLEEQTACLTISDQGVGMAESIIPNIMEPFFTTKERNTGLGLSVSYKIIKDHGGDISINSRLDHGTTVEIRLPAVKPANPELIPGSESA